MPQMPPRFEISRPEIDRVVQRFYEEVRQHPSLGPVFARHVEDWTSHEAKIADFWANAILHERGYDGNPMQVHRDAGDVRPGMFAPWLALFDTVLQRELPLETAQKWSAMAHNIGRSLRAGVVEKAKAANGAPLLR